MLSFIGWFLRNQCIFYFFLNKKKEKTYFAILLLKLTPFKTLLLHVIKLLINLSKLQEICMTNEFSKFRPRKCNYKLCAFCEKYKDVKPIFMKGFCENRVIRYFDKEYYLDGLKNKRMFFRYKKHNTKKFKFLNFC